MPKACALTPELRELFDVRSRVQSVYNQTHVISFPELTQRLVALCAMMGRYKQREGKIADTNAALWVSSEGLDISKQR
jgi:hypothetical protein